MKPFCSLSNILNPSVKSSALCCSRERLIVCMIGRNTSNDTLASESRIIRHMLDLTAVQVGGSTILKLLSCLFWHRLKTGFD